MPPKYFGVTYNDIKIMNGAKPIFEVERNLRKIMCGCIIIGHGMRLDIGVITAAIWEQVSTVGTQNMYDQVALPKLAERYFGDSIQEEFHDPTEDAGATMLLCLRVHPYQKRTSFKDAKYVLAAEEFPALGAPAKKRR